MKKHLIIGFVLLSGVFSLSPAVYAASTDTPVAKNYYEYWKNWIQRRSNSSLRAIPTLRYTGRTTTRSLNPNASVHEYQQATASTQRRTTNRVQSVSTESSTTGNVDRSTWNPSRYNLSNYRTQSNYMDAYSTTGTAGLVDVIVNPLRQSKAVTELSAEEVPIFRIGVTREGTSRSTVYTEAALVTQMTFQMFANTGIAADPSDFEIVIEGETMSFDEDGMVTVRFGNLRVARGESRSFDVAVKVDNPSSTPNIPGSLSLRLLSIDAYTELSKEPITARIRGSNISNVTLFDPIPQTSGTPQIASYNPQIFGRTLEAGEKALVLSLHMEAENDDMLIEELSVRNTVGGNNVDSLINKIRVIDLSKGYVLDESRFSGGSATFHFPKEVFIGRGDSKDIGFEIEVKGQVPTGVSSTTFKLDVGASDMVVRGIGSGREVPNNSKTISSNTEEFVIAEADVRVMPSAQQPSVVGVGGLFSEAFRFQIVNGSDKSISLGRITLRPFLSGVQFPGGLSADDVQLKERDKGYQVQREVFTPSIVSGRIRFDATGQVTIAPHSSLEFSLNARFDDDGNGGDGDSVSFVVEADSSYKKDTLANVRASGANFIWSDHSGRPHTSTSSDWLTGYQMRGLPTNAVRVGR